ncbi:MAG: acyl-CoA dehydrogenase family protein [Thermoplasmata archaeon]
MASLVSLPGESEEWRSRAHAYARDQLEPLAAEIDRTDRISETILKGLASQRFTGLGTPSEWGGAGGDARDVAAVLEELAWASGAVATLLAVHLSVCAAPILEWGTTAQKERFLRPLSEGRIIGAFGLTEPGAGSDAARLQCRYRRTPDGFVLDGTKMFITDAGLAGVTLAFATQDMSLGHRGISAFLVPRDTPGFSVAQRLDKLGIRGSETTELVFQSAKLPFDALLGAEGSGFKIALSALTGGRVGIAACALGVARGAFDEMRLSVEQDPTDWKRGILADSFAQLAAASALVANAAARKAAKLPYIDQASAAKLFASRTAVTLANRGLEIAGLSATRSGHRAERLFRDARVFPIVEGTTEIQELILGRALLDRSAEAGGHETL